MNRWNVGATIDDRIALDSFHVASVIGEMRRKASDKVMEVLGDGNFHLFRYREVKPEINHCRRATHIGAELEEGDVEIVGRPAMKVLDDWTPALSNPRAAENLFYRVLPSLMPPERIVEKIVERIVEPPPKPLTKWQEVLGIARDFFADPEKLCKRFDC